MESFNQGFKNSMANFSFFFLAFLISFGTTKKITFLLSRTQERRGGLWVEQLKSHHPLHSVREKTKSWNLVLFECPLCNRADTERSVSKSVIFLFHLALVIICFWLPILRFQNLFCSWAVASSFPSLTTRKDYWTHMLRPQVFQLIIVFVCVLVPNCPQTVQNPVWRS